MMATFSLERCKKIEQTIKDAVFGYIKQYCQPLLPYNNPYYNIPMLVKQICLCYYAQEKDKWDIKLKGDYIIINDDIVSCDIEKHRNFQSAFLSKKISSGIHHWKFELIKFNIDQWNLFGIWKTNSGVPLLNTCFTNKRNNGYSFVATHGKLLNLNDFYMCGKEYGKKCKKGDIIDMYLNMNKLQLSFAINDKNYGKAYDIDNTQYRAAISMRPTGSFKLLLYEIISIK